VKIRVQAVTRVNSRNQKSVKSSFYVLNRDLRLVLFSNMMGSFGDGLYAYLLPVYMTETLSASSVEVGILYAVVNLVAALTLLLAGILADRYDRKKILIAGWIAWVPAPLVFSMAKNWIGMLPGMALWGFWLGGPTMTAYVVTTADRDRLTTVFTAISGAWSLGYVFSPALGGYLATITGMKVVFVLSSIFYGVAGLVLLFITSQRPSSHARELCSEEDHSFFQLLRTRRLSVLTVFFASIMFTLMLFRPFISKFLADVYEYSDFEIGVSGSILFLGSAVLGVLLGRLGDRLKKTYALASALLICAVSMTFLLFFGDFRILLIAIFLAGCSYTMWSLMNAIVGPLAPKSIRARWVSIPQTVSMFSSSIAPYAGGILYAASPRYPFVVAIVVMLSLAALASTGILEKLDAVRKVGG
jgi:MFS family permease